MILKYLYILHSSLQPNDRIIYYNRYFHFS